MSAYFNRQRVLVTGASSGIGRAFAARIAADGGDLVLIARRDALLQTLADELRERFGTSVEVITADLSTPGAASRIADVLTQRSIVVDALVNNAGLGIHGDLAGADLGAISNQIAVNVTALTELTAILFTGHGHSRTGSRGQRGEYRRISAGTSHGGICRDKSICTLLHPRLVVRVPRHRRPGIGRESGCNRHRVLRSRRR